MKNEIQELGLYVHVPFCRSKCSYCGFYSRPIGDYDCKRAISAIVTEMDIYDLKDNVRTIYIGGGSPSCLPIEHLLTLVKEVIQRCGETLEFTVEVNPGQVSENILHDMQKLGVNRLSIGAQTFIPWELELLGRGHSAEDISKAVSAARKAGFENISLDLIFAVPGSDIDSWRFDLESAIRLGVEHISTYSLTYEEGTKLKSQTDSGKVIRIGEELDRDMYELAIDMLAGAGFKHYEISNFAKAVFECKHNMRYWANEGYVGVGPSASSYFNGQRYTNVADIEQYIQMIEKGEDVRGEVEELGVVERACETAVLNLRRIKGVNLKEFSVKTGLDFMELFAEPVKKYSREGLMKVTKNGVCLSRNALGIADGILCDFAAV